MKLFIITLLGICLCFFCLSGVYAGEQPEQMYKSEINRQISFYESRLYLLDSEYTILSDIGKDAKKMLSYLYEKKNDLVNEMVKKELVNNPKKIRTFVVNRARMATDVWLAHTKP